MRAIGINSNAFKVRLVAPGEAYVGRISVSGVGRER